MLNKVALSSHATLKRLYPDWSHSVISKRKDISGDGSHVPFLYYLLTVYNRSYIIIVHLFLGLVDKKIIIFIFFRARKLWVCLRMSVELQCCH